MVWKLSFHIKIHLWDVHTLNTRTHTHAHTHLQTQLQQACEATQIKQNVVFFCEPAPCKPKWIQIQLNLSCSLAFWWEPTQSARLHMWVCNVCSCNCNTITCTLSWFNCANRLSPASPGGAGLPPTASQMGPLSAQLRNELLSIGLVLKSAWGNRKWWSMASLGDIAVLRGGLRTDDVCKGIKTGLWGKKG